MAAASSYPLEDDPCWEKTGLAGTLELCLLPGIKSTAATFPASAVSTQPHMWAAAPPFLGIRASGISVGLKPLATVLGCWKGPCTQWAAKRERVALGAICRRANTWQQRAPRVALLRQTDRDTLVLELESGAIAMVQASWGEGTGHGRGVSIITRKRSEVKNEQGSVERNSCHKCLCVL